MSSSRTTLTGEGKPKVFAICIEKGLAFQPDIVYTQAKERGEVLAALATGRMQLPKSTRRIVGVAEAVGYWHDEQGKDLVL